MILLSHVSTEWYADVSSCIHRVEPFDARASTLRTGTRMREPRRWDSVSRHAAVAPVSAPCWTGAGCGALRPGWSSRSRQRIPGCPAAAAGAGP